MWTQSLRRTARYMTMELFVYFFNFLFIYFFLNFLILFIFYLFFLIYLCIPDFGIINILEEIHDIDLMQYYVTLVCKGVSEE
jgi:hypothetical protein